MENKTEKTNDLLLPDEEVKRIMKSAADRDERVILSLMETAGMTRDEAEELMADTSIRRIARWKIPNFENMTD